VRAPACSRAFIATTYTVKRAARPKSNRCKGARFPALSIRLATRSCRRRRMQGSDAVAAVLAQLEGFEAPCGARGESDIIPARISEYDPHWVGRGIGRAGPIRLGAARGTQRANRTKARGPYARRPITMPRETEREGLDSAHPIARSGAAQLQNRGPPSTFIQERGGFFSSMRLPTAVGLPAGRSGRGARRTRGAWPRELPIAFGGLRAPLLVPSSRRGKPSSAGRRSSKRLAMFGMADAGRMGSSCGRTQTDSVRRPRRGGPSNMWCGTLACAVWGRDLLEIIGARGRLAAELGATS